MIIKLDDLRGAKIAVLLQEHLQAMHALSPRESVHALDIEALRQPGISFWSAWEQDELLGCGALWELDATHGEVKSMRTAAAHQRKGVARALLMHILEQAQARGYQRLSLETGSMKEFLPSQTLYRSLGFEFCPPFGAYAPDPNSVFMSKVLDPSPRRPDGVARL